MRKMLYMMVLGLLLGSQTMTFSEARIGHISKADVELNWKKQMQLSKGSLSKNVQNAVYEFLNDYSEASGVKIEKALSTFLKSRRFSRNEQKTITGILLNGKLINQKNKVVKASTVTLKAIAADDEDGDDKVVRKNIRKKYGNKKDMKEEKKKYTKPKRVMDEDDNDFDYEKNKKKKDKKSKYVEEDDDIDASDDGEVVDIGEDGADDADGASPDEYDEDEE